MSGLPAQLRFVREHYGLSLARVAQMVGRDVATIMSWEAGTAEPSGRDIPRLRGSFPSLSPYLRRETSPSPRVAAGSMVKKIRAEDVFRPPTFSAMLREARDAAKLSTAELGDLVGVSGDAIAELETGRGAVDAGVYETLVDLIPDLRMAARPTLLDASNEPSTPRSLPGVPAQFLPPRVGPPPGTDAPPKAYSLTTKPVTIAPVVIDTLAGANELSEKLRIAFDANAAEAKAIVAARAAQADEARFAMEQTSEPPPPSLADQWAAAMLAHRRALKTAERLEQQAARAREDVQKARYAEELARAALDNDINEKAGAP